MTAAPALVAAAVSIGSIHTLAPDHWVPFAALARAQRWSARRTALITAACGLGHVTGSVALGLLSVFLGVELLQHFGQRLESASGLLLIGFGVAYAVWGLRRSARCAPARPWTRSWPASWSRPQPRSQPQPVIAEPVGVVRAVLGGSVRGRHPADVRVGATWMADDAERHRRV